MRILIANFDRQTIVAKEEVVAALRSLPRSHISGLQVVRYDPSRVIPQVMARLNDEYISTRPQGSYYHAEDLSAIVLFRFSSRAEFHHLLFHEVGHYVFLRFLQQAQRDEWMYSIRKQETGTVTAYARTNAREDFAETYAVYLTQLRLLDKLPVKRRFFQNHVFATD